MSHTQNKVNERMELRMKEINPGIKKVQNHIKRYLIKRERREYKRVMRRTIFTGDINSYLE